jgi:hypothetical protein
MSLQYTCSSIKPLKDDKKNCWCVFREDQFVLLDINIFRIRNSYWIELSVVKVFRSWVCCLFFFCFWSSFIILVSTLLLFLLCLRWNCYSSTASFQTVLRFLEANLRCLYFQFSNNLHHVRSQYTSKAFS